MVWDNNVMTLWSNLQWWMSLCCSWESQVVSRSTCLVLSHWRPWMDLCWLLGPCSPCQRPYTEHWVTWALEGDQLAMFKDHIQISCLSSLVYWNCAFHPVNAKGRNSVLLLHHVWENSHILSGMIWSFNGDQEHVKTANLGCTQVEKYNSLYIEEKEMRYSRYIRASCTLLPCSFGFRANPQSLDWARLFLFWKWISDINPLSLKILNTCKQVVKCF